MKQRDIRRMKYFDRYKGKTLDEIIDILIGKSHKP
jgi:hypothetical protein